MSQQTNFLSVLTMAVLRQSFYFHMAPWRAMQRHTASSDRHVLQLRMPILLACVQKIAAKFP